MRISEMNNQLSRCREVIYSNDYYDIIIDYVGGYTVQDPVCLQRISEKFDVGHYPREGSPELNIQDFPYMAIPKCFALTDQAALEASGILRLQNANALDLNGQGVLLGFVDSGIAYQNPVFQNTDGTTRIAGIWDQTIEDGTPPDGFLYGAFYDEAAINEALRSENPLEIVPAADEIGHGTFLAGVACGSSDAAADFNGAAPQSAIAVVKCKQAKPYLREFYFVPEGVPCYQENDLMSGIAWLHQYAYELHMPLIICVGMGTSMGNHAGDDPVSVLVEDVGRQRQRGVVVSAGNEASRRHHYVQSGLAEGAEDQIEISVGAGVDGFFLELWASIPEIYSISVLSPTGERMPRVSGSFARRQVYTFLFEKTTLTVDYTIAGARLGGQLIYLRFENPLQGIWTIQVVPEQVIDGIFNCWLPVSEFLSGEVFFLRSNPDTTILAPGMAPIAVTAGAYQANGGNIYPDSGRGFSTTNTIKPDILAPGVTVYGPERQGGYGTRTGTSVAAAITAGGCAQLFQWGIVENNLIYLNSTDLSNLLIRGAVRSEDRNYPDQAYGYGLLNVYDALNRLRPQQSF